jgi:hypothetical protein
LGGGGTTRKTDSRRRPAKKRAAPPELVATGPNQIFCSDITYLTFRVSGMVLYAYRIVGGRWKTRRANNTP